MNKDGLTNFLGTDRILPRVDAVLQKSATHCNVEIISLILFGSKASGDRNSLNDYEILVLLHDDTKLERYISFTNVVRLDLLKAKLPNVKISVFTPGTFESILYNEKMVGTYLYIICRDHLIMMDKGNVFLALLARLRKNTIRPEEKFLEQCIEFAKDLGSEKWGRKWEKALMQHKYYKKRRNGL